MKIYSQSDIVFKYSNLVLLLMMMLSKTILEIRNAKYAKACPPIHDKKKNKKMKQEGRWENRISMALENLLCNNFAPLFNLSFWYAYIISFLFDSSHDLIFVKSDSQKIYKSVNWFKNPIDEK